jgi:hypothetical protein
MEMEMSRIYDTGTRRPYGDQRALKKKRQGDLGSARHGLTKAINPRRRPAALDPRTWGRQFSAGSGEESKDFNGSRQDRRRRWREGGIEDEEEWIRQAQIAEMEWGKRNSLSLRRPRRELSEHVARGPTMSRARALPDGTVHGSRALHVCSRLAVLTS